MNTIFLLLLLGSLFSVPVFITIALINLMRKRSFKKSFKIIGIPTLILVISFVGYGITLDNDVPPTKNSYNSVSTEAPSSTYTLAESIPAEPSPTPTNALAPSSAPSPIPTTTVVPTPEPTPQPTLAPTPEPTPIPTEVPTPQLTPISTPVPTENPTNSMDTENSIIVWVDDTAKRYHKKNGCGMDNAYQVTLEEAIKMGKTPCGNCYR